MEKLSKLFVCIAIIVWFGCNQSKKNDEAMSESMNGKTAALSRTDMDTTVKPGNDFYMFAHGTWIKNLQMPEEYSRYGAFEILQENNEKKLRTLVEEVAAEEAEPGSNEQKVGDFFKTGMDSAKIEEDGIKPLQKHFDKIEAIENTTDLQNVAAGFQQMGVSPFFYIFSSQDKKDSEKVIAQIWQGGIGMSDRDYYTEDDARSKELREKYVEHLTKMFVLLGDSQEEAEKNAQTVMNIETQFAKASLTRLECRDPYRVYNKMTLKELQSHTPNFDWEAYFSNLGYPDVKEINVSQPDFIDKMGKMMKSVSIDDWKTYMRWVLIDRTAPYLNSAIVEQNFDFFGKTMTGKQTMRPRWKRVLSSTNGALGEVVGQVYVKKYFPPEAKDRIYNLVMNLKKSFAQRLENVVWMGDSTKQKALEKLEVMSVKVGYPDKWRDYSDLEIKTDSYVENVLRARKSNFTYSMDKIGKPVDRDEWHMYPQTVNAYYNPAMNEIVFPAGILQPPFFYKDADNAVNYGAIGSVIGHEMTHGFDDQGRHYDKDGNLNEWWTEKDAEEFNKRVQLLVEQYDNFVALDTLTVNGKLTLGENIADFGGTTISYNALQMALEGKERKKIDGFTPEQRFFLSYAKVWRQKIRDEELMRRLREDVHSPGHFRVNGPIFNIPQFYETFNISPEDELFIAEDKRAVVW